MSDTDMIHVLDSDFTAGCKNLETVVSIPLFCKRHCSLPTLDPPWREQAVFTATLLRLFFLGQRLSERVKCSASYAPVSF